LRERAHSSHFTSKEKEAKQAPEKEGWKARKTGAGGGWLSKV
jgi:hypothetical protein